MKLRKLTIILLIILALTTTVWARTAVQIGDLGIITGPTTFQRYTTLNALITAVGAAPTTAIINATITATTVTVPITLTLDFKEAGLLSPAGGQVVTFAGDRSQVIAPEDQQIFGGVGTVVFTGGGVGTAELWGIDGAADDVQINMAYASGLTTVELLSKTYIGNAQITITKDANLIGQGTKNSIIDCSGALGAFPDDACVYAAGDGLTSLGILAGNIAKGSKAVTLGAAPAVVGGDVIVIHDTANNSYSNWRTYYKAGEYGVVHSVAGTTITLATGTYAAYAIGGTRLVYSLATTSSQIKDLQVIGRGAGNTTNGITIEFGRGASIENVKVTNSADTNVAITKSFNVTVKNLDSMKLSPDVGGLSYALAILNSQSIKVSDSNLIAIRHGLTVTGGGGDGNVVNRDIQIEHNTIENTTVGVANQGVTAANFHGNVEYSVFRDNIMTGVTLAGNHNSIIDNTIRKESTQAYAIHFGELSGFDHTIEGNKVYIDSEPNTGRGAFLNVGGGEDSLTAYTTAGGTFNVSDNKVYYLVEDSAFSAARIVNRGSTQTDLRIVFENNKIIGTYGSRGNNYGLAVEVVSGAAFADVQASDNTLYSFGIRIEGAVSIKLANNTIEKAGQQGIYLLDGGVITETPDLYSVIGNIVKSSNLTGIYVAGAAGAKMDRAIVDHNVSIENSRSDSGASPPNSDLYILEVVEAYSRHNILGSNEAEQDQPAYYDTITTLYEESNTYFGTGLRQRYDTVATFGNIRERVLGIDQAVDMQTAATKTNIFQVPTGSKAVITKVIIHSPSATLVGGTDYDLGSGGAANTWLQTNDLSGMTLTTDYRVITSENTKYTLEAAGVEFGIYVNTGSAGVATATIEVIGYLVPN